MFECYKEGVNEYERDTILRIAASLADHARRLRTLACPQPEPKPAPPAFSPATMDDLDRRIAALESRVRRTAHQIDAVREAMDACRRNDRLHASVRHLADTIALNLGAEPPAPTTVFAAGERVVITHWDRHGVVVGRDEAGITVKCDDGEVVIVGDDSLLMEEEIADA